jgi:ubiquinone/menaquinone biosynthesis C-methylase UbiE
MGVYERFLLPRLIDRAMRHRDLSPHRARLLQGARGRVLEVGIGSGLNLPLYGEAVAQVIGVDPSPELLRRTRALAARSPRPVSLLQARAEALPLARTSIDTVVMAWTLCSLSEPRAGLAEMRRVLRPDGALLFVKHGLAPEPRIAAWQHRLGPFWRRISCHLDNRVDALLREAGFEVARLQAGYLGKGPRALTYMYEGVARPSSRA